MRHARGTDPRLGAAGEDLRRQGGGRLSPGQADHQAHQRRGRRDQQRPDLARHAEGRVLPQLQRQPGRGDHSGLRCFRADFDGGDGGVGNRQHEAGVERRADHRHAGRRQHRNPRPRRRGEHLHFRSDRGGGGAAPRPRYRRARDHRGLSAVAARAGRDRLRTVLAVGARPVPRPGGCADLPRPLPGLRRLRLLRRRAAPGRGEVARSGGVVALEHSQHRRRRLVLLRPRDPRILRRHLEREAVRPDVARTPEPRPRRRPRRPGRPARPPSPPSSAPAMAIRSRSSARM